MRFFWQKACPVVEPEPLTLGELDNGKLTECSETWRYIRNWATCEIEKARKRNDSPLLDAEKTALVRGEIVALKRLVKLPETILSRDLRLTRSNRLQAGEDDE